MSNAVYAIFVVLAIALAIWGLIVGIGHHDWQFGTYLAVYALISVWAGGLLSSKLLASPPG